MIATVMPDGSTWWKYFQRSTNWGKPIATIEKWVENGVDNFRTNTFLYSADGLDLVEERFMASGIDHLVAGYGYDAYHHVTSVTNALGEISTSTYDGSQRLVTHQSASGLISSNSYGLDGRVSEVVVYESGGNPVSTNQYTWSGGNLLTHTDPRGLTTTHTWDALARLTKIDFPDGSYLKHAYTNGSGTMLLHRTYTRDRMTNETRWTYTPNRQVENIIDPRGITNHFEYCDCGSLQSATTGYLTPLAETTDYFYDNRMRLVEIDFPNGSWKTNAYDSLGRLIVQGDPLGSSTNTYDNLSRLLTSSNAFGQSFKAIYDVESQITSRTDANGVTVASTYDDLHRVRTRTFPDSGIESFGYTANVSGPTSYTNQLAKVTTYAYDKLGRKTNEIIVGIATNSFTFGPAGDLLTLTDGKSQTTTWAYDLYGRVATKKYANNVTNLIYAYDASSRLTNRWSGAKGNTAYEYDANGNLTKINYPTSPDVTFAYDAHNRSTNEIVAGTFTNTFTYHPGGALATEDGPWPNDTLTYTYNTAGLRDALTIQQPTGTFTNGYTYDAAHRLTGITATSGTFTYDYIPENNSITAPTRLIGRLTLPPGSYITNFYDTNARQTRTRLMTSAHAELNDHQYLYNVGNQRTQQTRTDDSYATYTYDDAGQLRTAYTTNSAGSEITAQRYMYGYDAAWNMIKRTNNATVSTYSPNNLNEIISHYTYDANGNPSVGGGGAFIYEFDDENRLSRISIDTNNISPVRTEYLYDARGRLRKTINYTWDAGFEQWGMTSESRAIYDGMLEVQERNHVNTPTVTYTRGLDLSGTIQGAGGIGGMLARSSSYQSGTGAWNTKVFYHADANGNITYLIQNNETMGATYRYDPFGRTIASSGTFATANLYRFSSKRYDTTWGLYYYGYRFYDVLNHRWLNRDPIGELGDDNLYRFTLNEPIMSIDSVGLHPVLVRILPEIAKRIPKRVPRFFPPIFTRKPNEPQPAPPANPFQPLKPTPRPPFFPDPRCQPKPNPENDACVKGCNEDYDANAKACDQEPPSTQAKCHEDVLRQNNECVRQCNRDYPDR